MTEIDTTLSTVGEHIRGVLISAGISPVYVGTLPALDTNGVAVQLYNGATPRRFLSGQSTLFYANLRIHIRNKSYPIGAAWSDTIVNALDRTRGSNVLGIHMTGAPLYLGQTSEKIHEFQHVYRLIIETTKGVTTDG